MKSVCEPLWGFLCVRLIQVPPHKATYGFSSEPEDSRAGPISDRVVNPVALKSGLQCIRSTTPEVAHGRHTRLIAEEQNGTHPRPKPAT
jgi:hypothetical protein